MEIERNGKSQKIDQLYDRSAHPILILVNPFGEEQHHLQQGSVNDSTG
ncbi:MAG: hypothetical protein ACYC9S_08165 [Leptospirales bacterium]